MSATCSWFRPAAVLTLVSLSLIPQPSWGLTEEEAQRFRQLFNSGRRAFELEQYEMASQAFTEAARLDPRSARIQLYLGRAFYGLHHFKQAEGALRRALELTPDGWEARFYLARVLREQIRFDEAMTEFRKVAAASRTWQEPLYYMGQLLYQRGQYEQARKELERAVALISAETPLASRRAITYQLALTHQRLGNLAEAERHLRRAIEMDPQYARAFYTLAEVRERAGDNREAEQLWARFDEIQRADLESRELEARFNHHGRQGLLHLDRKEPQLAIKEFQRALEIQSTDPALYAFLGIALTDTGRIAAAIDAFKKAVELEPQHAISLTELGRLHAMKADFETALDYLERAVRANPSLMEAHEFLSFVYEDTGNQDAALRERRLLEDLRQSGKGESIYD